MIEYIKNGDETLGIIIRSSFEKDGIEFFTPGDYSQQLAYMKRPTGYEIQPHIHNIVQREVFYTQEVLYIKRGILKVDFYSKDKKYLESRTVTTGDVILLASGGHGMEVIEEVEMFEIKQGPYLGDMDKVRFNKNEGEAKNG
ncbi:MAG: hypothetical protein IJS47_03030 [Clostridia bacterium]|nr:hypothetical protein [Clostridia bacterium]